MNKKWVILFPAIVLLCLIGFKYFALFSGEQVILKVIEPIDPVDTFRGNYVNLRYEVTDLNYSNLKGETNFTYLDTVYVLFEEVNGSNDKIVPISIGKSFDSIALSNQDNSKKYFCMRGEVNNVIHNFSGIEANPIAIEKSVLNNSNSTNNSAINPTMNNPETTPIDPYENSPIIGISVTYGIESFFAPIEMAKKVEEERKNGNVNAIVVIDKQCNPILKSLKINGLIVETN